MIRFNKLLIDEKVMDSHIAALVRNGCRYQSLEIISHSDAQARIRGEIEEAVILPESKRTVLLTYNSGAFLKPMGNDPQVKDQQRSDAWRLELFQGCPLDCVYCFCQQYLSSHHTVIFTNIENAARELNDKAVGSQSRLVTGDIADSFSLGPLSVDLHRYALDVLPESRFELRTKFLLPENFHILDRKRVRIDWSLSPETARQLNEPGTASPLLRIESIAKAVETGFTVGVRLDPLQNDPDEFESINRESYSNLLSALRDRLGDKTVGRFIIGSFKMSSELKEIISHRFPGHPLPGLEWSSCPDGKLRPHRTHRLRSYRIILGLLKQYFPEVPVSLSMELPFILNLLDA